MTKSRLICAAVAACVAFTAAPALAGLEFTDTLRIGAVTVDGGGNELVNFTFQGNTLNSTGLNAANAPLSDAFVSGAFANAVTVNNVTGGPAARNFVELDFTYTGNPHPSANYALGAGTPNYNIALQFGSITGGTAALLQLDSIAFSELGDPIFGVQHTVPFAITDAQAGSLLFINLQSPLQVPAGQRDLVDVVRLRFSFAANTNVSFQVVALANPEPGTLALFGLGLAGLGLAVARRRKKLTVAAAQE